jgi:hypothetical protein
MAEECIEIHFSEKDNRHFTDATLPTNLHTCEDCREQALMARESVEFRNNHVGRNIATEYKVNDKSSAGSHGVKKYPGPCTQFRAYINYSHFTIYLS